MAVNVLNNIVRYNSRTFGEIRDDLIAYIKQAYPEVLKDFSDSSVGAVLIDLNAGVANNLAINTDRVFQETQLEYAQQRASILNIAKNLGFNIPPKRPSVTVVDFTVTIPVLGNKPDSSYYPVLDAGAQIVGGGTVFETLYKVDWGSENSLFGYPNRKIVPNYDSNGIVINYLVSKREIVVNGATKIYKRVITNDDIVPFFSITLPDNNVIDIDGVILVEGVDYNVLPTYEEFYDNNKRYFEVDYLAQQRVFIEDTSNVKTDSSGIKAGKWFDVTKKFIKEYTSQGYCKLIFGSGDPDLNAFESGLLKEDVTNKYFLENFLNNTALGEKLKPNHTLFVKYRIGGGIDSNIGAGVLTQMGTYRLNVLGSRTDYNQIVQRSLKVTNPIPAIGGNDGLNVEQIRHLIKYNFSSQNRCVTLTDYILQIYKMPGRFGSPFRVNAYKENNKIMISILGIGSDGKLSNVSNSLLKENIAEYLSQYRMINDYIEIKDGKIFNLAFDIDIFVDNISDNTIANNVINIVKNYLDINKNEMNEDVYLGQLQNEILKVNGVINVIDIVVYNKVGGNYSLNMIGQEISDIGTGKIRIINNTIYSERDSMFEIKYPEKDIRVIMRKKIS